MKYFKTFSRRELYSALFSSMMMCSTAFFLKQFDITGPGDIFLVLTSMASIAMSHRFYLLEHKRRNNWIGRIMHDLLIMLFTTGIAAVALKISGEFYRVGYYSNLIIIIGILVFAYEFALSALNKFFKLFKWRIW